MYELAVSKWPASVTNGKYQSFSGLFYLAFFKKNVYFVFLIHLV